MGFENLTDIHARRHAERIEHDVDMGAVIEERHVFHRHDLRDDALVAVTAGHLVARLQLALHRDEHFDDLHHARRQFIAALQLVDLVREARVEALLGVVVLLLQRFDLDHRVFRLRGRSATTGRAELVEHVLGDFALLEALGTRSRRLADEDLLQAAEDVALEDRSSSSRSLERRSISSRSICSARWSLSTPWRLNTRTSTTVR